MAEIIDVIMRLQDNVTSGLARIRNSMEETGKANQRMGRDIAKAGKNVSNLGEAMLPAAAGITALGAASVKTFMSFDQTITAAGVKAGATTEELEQMRMRLACCRMIPVTYRRAMSLSMVMMTTLLSTMARAVITATAHPAMSLYTAATTRKWECQSRK